MGIWKLVRGVFPFFFGWMLPKRRPRRVNRRQRQVRPAPLALPAPRTSKPLIQRLNSQQVNSIRSARFGSSVTITIPADFDRSDWNQVDAALRRASGRNITCTPSGQFALTVTVY